MQSQATYNYKVVRQFAVMTVIWGIVGMLVGVLIASQLVWPQLNIIEFLGYGRLRPLHTNAVIFAFGGCALFATSYYSVQRTCHTPLFLPGLAAFTFWGWQLVILLAALSLPLGFTSGKEYAELEWPIDILITIVWVSYAIVFFGTIAIRKVSHIYVSNWFFGSMIIAVALLHLVNSAAIPVTANTVLKPVSTFYQIALWSRFSGSGLESLLARMLSPEPEKRPWNGREAMNLLQAGLEGKMMLT